VSLVHTFRSSMQLSAVPVHSQWSYLSLSVQAKPSEHGSLLNTKEQPPPSSGAHLSLVHSLPSSQTTAIGVQPMSRWH